MIRIDLRATGQVFPARRGLIFCLAVLLSSGAAQAAAASEFCDGYANKAFSQIETAVKARCGFTGVRWSTDKEQHRNWCLSLNGDQTLPNSETDARDVAIDGCFAWCRRYAKQATDAAFANSSWNCDYPGPRWSMEPLDHVIWCQYTATHALADAETAARSAALDDCRGHIDQKPAGGDALKMKPPDVVPLPPGGTKKFFKP